MAKLNDRIIFLIKSKIEDTKVELNKAKSELNLANARQKVAQNNVEWFEAYLKDLTDALND